MDKCNIFSFYFLGLWSVFDVFVVAIIELLIDVTFAGEKFV